MKLLIIEDDLLLQQGLYDSLTSEGYICEIAHSVKQARNHLLAATFDLMIVDLGLPDGSGFELIQFCKTQKITTAILILTARDTIEDRVQGLDCGADDYLIKPFALTELLARLRAILRRNQGLDENIIERSPFKLNLKTNEIFFHQKLLSLTQKEFLVLSKLILKAGQKVNRHQLQNSLYDWHSDPSSNVLEVYIHSLRKKIGKDLIRTNRGFGYQLVIE